MNSKSIYVIAGVLILILILFLIFSSKPYQWFESMSIDDKNPYDVSILYNVLAESKGESNFQLIEENEKIENYLQSTSENENSNFICFGPKLHTDSSDISSLLDFAEKGNNVFLFSKFFNSELLDTLLLVNKDSMINDLESMSVQERDIVDKWIESDDELWDEEEWYFENDDSTFSENDNSEAGDSINDAQKEQIKNLKKLFDRSYVDRYLDSHNDTLCSFNFFDEKNKFEKDLKTIKQFSKKTTFKDWAYFNEVALKYSEADITPIAYLESERVNFIKIKTGSGNIFLHSTPLVFTNYNFIKDDFYKYASIALEEIGNGKTYWDESLRTSDMEWNFFNEGEGRGISEGPLAFILSEPSLKWAWYLILISAFLYLILGVRRKQKAIPVFHQNKNTSIEYAETIVQLFYRKKDHRALIAMKMNQLKSFIQNTYGFRVKYDDDFEKNKIIDKISLHSNVAKTEILKIFNEFNTSITSSEVSKTMLVAFHDVLEDFYKKCK